AGAHLPGDRDLLRLGEQRGLTYLMEVLVQDVAIGIIDAQTLGRLPLAGAARLLGGGGQNLGGREVVAEGRQGRGRGSRGGRRSRGFLLRHGSSEALPDAPWGSARFCLTPPGARTSLPCWRRPGAGRANINGGVAQLGERVNGIHEVRGSIPLASTARRS